MTHALGTSAPNPVAVHRPEPDLVPVLVRRELPGGAGAVADVHADAFAPAYPDGVPVVPGLVDALRGSDA